MSNTFIIGGGFSLQGPQQAGSPISGLHNGTSIDGGGLGVLGQDVGAAGNPAILLNDREIPMQSHFIFMTGVGFTGGLVIGASVDQALGVLQVADTASVFDSSDPQNIRVTISPGSSGVTVVGTNTPTRKGLHVAINGLANSGDFAMSRVNGAAVWALLMDVGGFGAMGLFNIGGNAFIAAASTALTDNGNQLQVKGKGTAHVATSLGIGSAAAAVTQTALVSISPGTAAAGTAPLKIAPGVILATPEVGAVESDGDQLRFTLQTATERRIILTLQGALTNTRVLFMSATGVTQSSNLVFESAGGGTLAIGTAIVAGAYLQVAAGTTVKAPFRYVAGTNVTTIVNGNKEFDGTNEFLSAGGVRYTMAKTLVATASLNFPSTAAGTSSDLTIAVTGAADGDVVSLGVPIASQVVNGVFSAFVSAANTVTVRFSNNDLVAAIDPAAGTFRVSIQKV